MDRALPGISARSRQPPAQSVRLAFGSFVAGVALHPRETFARLAVDARGVRFGVAAVAINAAMYQAVYVFLVLGGGRPTAFRPWLSIDPEHYYRWNAFFVVPTMFAAWLLASAIAQLVARAFGGRGTFEATAGALGGATLVASAWTSVHDVFTSCLGAFHVIDQRAYEDALSGGTAFAAMLWALMIAYLVAFVVLYAKAVQAVHGLRARSAGPIGALAFVAYQLLFVVFNR